MKFIIIPFAATAISFTQAVTLRNHVNGGCSGNSVQCSNIAHSTCCGSIQDYSDSVYVTGLPTLSIASLIEKSGNEDCRGKVVISNSGLSLCITNPDGIGWTAGSMWHLICSSSCNRDEASDFMKLPEKERSMILNEKGCEGSVQPDKLILFDGHAFEIGNETSAEDFEALIGLARSKADATIDDVPEELLRLKVDLSAL